MSAGSPSAALDARGALGATSAGGRLREAREAAGLSVDAVAHQLKLAPRQVTALEEDDWQHLPGRTFIRGFARNYARFLRLDPDAVLALLPAAETTPALGRPALRTDTRPMGEIPAEREPSRGSSMRIVLSLVLLVIVAMVAYYELPRASLHVPEWLSARIGGLNSQAPKDATPATLPNPASSAMSASPSSTQAPTPGALALAPKVLGSEPGAPSATNNPDAASTPTPVTTPLTTSSPTDTPTTATANATPSAQSPASGEVALVLTFRGSSWAEVKDANGRVVLQMTGGAGMTQTVNAVPPLEVALGNAPAVDVTFRGQPLDLAPYTRGNVARVGLK
ncbi:MAG TPA: RodZ domain-containing protein [Casimicrobiaceae bacterium]